MEKSRRRDGNAQVPNTAMPGTKYCNAQVLGTAISRYQVLQCPDTKYYNAKELFSLWLCYQATQLYFLELSDAFRQPMFLNRSIIGALKQLSI